MRSTISTRRSIVDHPARFVVTVFATAVLSGAALLSLPFATQSRTTTEPLTALFTSTSAVCVTGLNIVDTGTYWSRFGQIVILMLIELGGLGFMTVASLFIIFLSGRIGLRQQLFAKTERASMSLGDVRHVVKVLGYVTFSVQGVVALIVALRLMGSYGYGIRRALWHGLFHSVSAYNNAGFSLNPDSLEIWAADPTVILPIAIAIIIGGLGFPVLLDLQVARGAMRRLSLHSKLTLSTTGVLIAVGMLSVTVAEWSNPKTLGEMGWGTKLLSGFFMGISPRTAGFSTVDIGAMNEITLLMTDGLMFIGAGSAGTSGGIKISTFAVLGLVIWAVLRGDPDINGFGRRVPFTLVSQAITVALCAVAVVFACTAALLSLENVDLSAALFESVSAFGTVGLSTGITPEIGDWSHIVLIGVMFLGRLGPITLGTALVLRAGNHRFRYPEEALLIG